MASISTVTTTVNLSMIGLQIFRGFKERNPWPDPKRSIGINWCSMGKNSCWEAVGPAQETVGSILCKIKDILESQHEYLNEGVCVRRVLLFDLYMIGRTEAQARPTIVFSCENKIQRQRAMKVVRESAILDGHPGVRLGESSRPPRLSSEPQQLGGPDLPNESFNEYGSHTQRPAEAATKGTIKTEPGESLTSSAQRARQLRCGSQDHINDVEMINDAATSSAFDKLVYCNLPLNGVHGIPIMIKDDKIAKFRKSTIGGFIYVGDQFFGLSVAHAFLENLQDTEDTEDIEIDDIEFSFEYDEDEDENTDEDEDFVNMTSRGSLSPTQNLPHKSMSIDPAEHSLPRTYSRTLSSLTFNKLAIEEASLSSFGCLSAISRASRTSNLDWALISIDPSLPPSVGDIRAHSFAQDPPGKVKVQVMTTTDHTIQGTITGCSTYMQLPQSISFQEMWSVQLDGPLKHGDCGSWVVDFDSGELYGYITAGDPQTSIAYIVPAYQAFHDIEQRLNGKVSLPNFEKTSSVSKAPTHETLRADDSHLPKGGCRYILLHPKVKGMMCNCVGFMWNQSTPGTVCDCGHYSCYHLPEKETNILVARSEFNALKEKIGLLESKLYEERQISQDFMDRVCRAEVLVDETKEKTGKEFQGVYQGVEDLSQNIRTLNKRAPYYDDHIERLIDDMQRMQNRIIEVDDSSTRIKDRLDAQETSSTYKNSFAAQQITIDGTETSNSTGPRVVASLEKITDHVRLFRERFSSMGAGHEAWTVHVSFLPSAVQPFPFERDTAAYKRCLSRGLHQVIVIPSTDHDSFTNAVNSAFSHILRGRLWQPLIARTCNAKRLNSLPMLRKLPERLLNCPFDAEFLQKNCAVVDEKGKIIDIYIAMVEDTISWHEMKGVETFKEGLESSWTYDSLLDGPEFVGADFNFRGTISDNLHTDGDIVPSWSPSLKRKESEICRTASFDSLSQPQPSLTGLEKRTRQRYIV